MEKTVDCILKNECERSNWNWEVNFAKWVNVSPPLFYVFGDIDGIGVPWWNGMYKTAE